MKRSMLVTRSRGWNGSGLGAGIRDIASTLASGELELELVDFLVLRFGFFFPVFHFLLKFRDALVALVSEGIIAFGEGFALGAEGADAGFAVDDSLDAKVAVAVLFGLDH